MDFENVGFSKTVDTTKYLSCADCDAGPIGYHDTQSNPKEFLVNVRRARYQFQTVVLFISLYHFCIITKHVGFFMDVLDMWFIATC